MTDIRLDFERELRCGVEEAIFCQTKSLAQIEEILSFAQHQHRRLLLTRLQKEKYLALAEKYRDFLFYDDIAQCAVLGCYQQHFEYTNIAIVSGGSSDAKVCYESLMTLRYHGYNADLFMDVGVAGMWRLQENLPRLQNYLLIIAVAGMEAALVTVLAGLVDLPIIAVPTSVGYGVTEGGKTALYACLGGCSAGVMTMNIDNGFGAACAAVKIMKKFKQ